MGSCQWIVSTDSNTGSPDVMGSPAIKASACIVEIVGGGNLTPGFTFPSKQRDNGARLSEPLSIEF